MHTKIAYQFMACVNLIYQDAVMYNSCTELDINRPCMYFWFIIKIVCYTAETPLTRSDPQNKTKSNTYKKTLILPIKFQKKTERFQNYGGKKKVYEIKSFRRNG